MHRFNFSQITTTKNHVLPLEGIFSQISTPHDLIKEIEAAADVTFGYLSSEMIVFPKKRLKKWVINPMIIEVFI
ncbi:hypothetical protein BW143_06905 [Bacillus swezeyi]|uniref:Uncharacterized protein n=1 Tax=Bacillus swezeyi TaxID=1925020 RepID=A0A1R1QSG8_9BACI|nr:hypothetical protein BW143_06905 [Bacillus swezeyi]